MFTGIISAIGRIDDIQKARGLAAENHYTVGLCTKLIWAHLSPVLVSV